MNDWHRNETIITSDILICISNEKSMRNQSVKSELYIC